MVKAKGRETGSGKKLMTRASGEVAEIAEKVRFSYSTEDQPLVQRAFIQAIEKIGGQRKLKKLYVQHQKNLKDGQNFFDSALRLLRMRLEYDEAALARTPRTGPVIFIANHLFIKNGSVVGFFYKRGGRFGDCI